MFKLISILLICLVVSSSAFADCQDQPGKWVVVNNSGAVKVILNSCTGELFRIIEIDNSVTVDQITAPIKKEQLKDK